MKQVNISIHPFSALVGMAVLSIVWVSAAAMPLQGSSSDRDVSAIENVNDPHPRDYVILRGNQPYTVPSGRLLVLTSAGRNDTWSMSVTVWVDGVQEVYVVGFGTGNGWSVSTSSVIDLGAPGLVVQSGQVVEMFAEADRAWGYLVDA
jgi:hypothetical protein